MSTDNAKVDGFETTFDNNGVAMIVIPLSEYNSLKDDQLLLNYYEAAGIDNTMAGEEGYINFLKAKGEFDT